MPGQLSMSIPDKLYIPLVKRAEAEGKSIQDIVRDLLKKEFNSDGD